MTARLTVSYLLVTTLNGAVSLKEVNSVTFGIGEDLDLDVSRSVEESFD